MSLTDERAGVLPAGVPETASGDAAGALAGERPQGTAGARPGLRAGTRPVASADERTVVSADGGPVVSADERPLAPAGPAPLTDERPLAPAGPAPLTDERPDAPAGPAPLTDQRPVTLSGRDAYRDELTRLAASDDTIVCLEADLGGKGHPFQAAHPERFLNLGIAEGAMVDMAAGLAAGGHKPFVSTFAPFAALRAAESLKLTLGYLAAGVTVVAPYAGVSGAWFGTTHHCLEDLAILRSVPGVTIAAPYGDTEMRAVVREAVRSGRPHYIRTGRNATYESLPALGDELPLVNWEFRAGPEDVCLVSVGEEGTRLALAARRAVPGTAHAHLVYLDHEHLTEAAAELARHHARFVVVEEHRGQGGVAEALALLLPSCRVTSVSADRSWPSQGGDHEEVMAALGLDLPAVLEALDRASTTSTASAGRPTN
ncbi:transketolase family protein [Streptomyces sp. NBC_00310]|uniref:transketolase family protein n=1 Tax=Streptomyces sp. NBC_00310 TaxID=2903645 RepID=UPI002E230EFF